MSNKNTVELKDLRMPMSLRRVFAATFIFALIFTAIPMFSQGIGNIGQRGKELAIAFVALVFVMLVVSVLRMKHYYIYDDGHTVRICRVDELPSYAIPVFCLRLSSLGCWAWVFGPRAQFWPIIKVMDIRGDEMHLQLRDAGGKCCDVLHPAVAIECVKRFNSVREIAHAATQGSEEREQLEMRFRSIVRELMMLEKTLISLEGEERGKQCVHELILMQRQLEEIRKFLPSGLWEEALASTSDIRKAVLSSARNRVTGLPGPRE